MPAILPSVRDQIPHASPASAPHPAAMQHAWQSVAAGSYRACPALRTGPWSCPGLLCVCRIWTSFADSTAQIIKALDDVPYSLHHGLLVAWCAESGAIPMSG